MDKQVIEMYSSIGSVRKVAIILKRDPKTIRNILKRNNIKVRRTTDGYDITNHKFGKLFVLERVGKSYDNCYSWRCRCDCGRVEDFSYHCLKSGKQNKCRRCSRINSARLLANGERYKILGPRLLRSIKRGAKCRGLVYELDAKFLYELYEKQDGKCALTGLPIIIGKEVGMPDVEITASLDRIDSSKGYTEDNVQWLHKDVNIMKCNFTIERFMELCELIVKNKN